MSSTRTPVSLTVEGSTGILRIEREHGNAINAPLLESLMALAQELASNPAVRGAMLTASGRIFCPGLDLKELVDYDRPAMERFMERFSATLMVLYTFPKPLLAAISGHALAGGCILALTADWRVLRRGALVGLNEIKVGVPLPYGVAMILRESVHSNRLDECALLGRNYTDAEAIETGLVHEVVDEAKFEAVCRERLEEYASKDLQAFAITKRYLRAATVERMRAHDRLFLQEFLDCWFAEPTRQRISAVVAELAARGK